jgi:hypothetical protein
MKLNESMLRFRLASRDIFNYYFHIDDPYTNNGWVQYEQFKSVEELLFVKLVSELVSMEMSEYGYVQKNIKVKLRGNINQAPIMLNRDINSCYWDYPIKEVIDTVEMLFISFFDWDSLDYHDNRYVRVQIASWPSYPELTGKHALVESKDVQFVTR